MKIIHINNTVIMIIRYLNIYKSLICEEYRVFPVPKLLLDDMIDFCLENKTKSNFDNEEDYKHIKNGNVMNINTNNYILFTYEDEDIALYEPFDNKIKPLIMF